MFLCLLAGLLLARPCLVDGDQLLEMSQADRQTLSPGGVMHSAFTTDVDRYPLSIIDYDNFLWILFYL